MPRADEILMTTLCAALRFDELPYGPMPHDTGVGSLLHPAVIIVMTLLAASLATVLAGGVMWLIRSRYQGDGPTLRHLARSFGLSRSEKRTVCRMAAVAGVAHPATLMVSAGCFERARARLETNGPARGSTSALLERIDRKLFGDDD